MSRARLSAEITFGALIGKLIKHKRAMRKSSQREAADVLGIQQPAYSRIEKGDTAITVSQLALLAGFLGTRPGKLLLGAEQLEDVLRKNGVKIIGNGQASEAGALLGMGILSAVLSRQKPQEAPRRANFSRYSGTNPFRIAVFGSTYVPLC